MTPLFGFFGLGYGEIIVLGIIAVLLFGKRLPDMAKWSTGKSVVEFKKPACTASRPASTTSPTPTRPPLPPKRRRRPRRFARRNASPCSRAEVRRRCTAASSRADQHARDREPAATVIALFVIGAWRRGKRGAWLRGHAQSGRLAQPGRAPSSHGGRRWFKSSNAHLKLD